MDFYRRCYGKDGYLTDFPGLTKESATWLGSQGIGMFGVEAVSPGRPGRNNFEVHHVCRDLGFTPWKASSISTSLSARAASADRLSPEDQRRHGKPDTGRGVAR